MEEEDLSINLFELYLPRYFKNMMLYYKGEILVNENQRDDKIDHRVANRNPFHKNISQETREDLFNHPVFQLEYEFYEFVKQRLYQQAIYNDLL